MPRRSLPYFDYSAILLSLVAVLVTRVVTQRIFEAVPHFEDEFAYTWQAEVFAGGKLYLPTPEHPQSFLVPFVVDYQGRRFSKYPPAWSLLLALGVIFRIRSWVNPLLAGLGIWLTYQLGKRVFTPQVGLLAAGLTLSSPFFLMNSGSLLNHPLGLVLSAGFAIAWLGAFGGQNPARAWRRTLLSAALVGLLGLTRPWTAVGLILPFAVHALILGWRGNRSVRLRLLAFVLLAGSISGLLFVWQYWMTGDPFLNTYTLWWPYDKIGFGPGYGVTETGHNLHLALNNTDHSLRVVWHDLFGWGMLSWLFLPIGLWAARRNGRALLIGSVFPSLVLVYMAYFVSPWILGPRYYYEGLYSLTLLSAAGIATAAGWPLDAEKTVPALPGRRKIRPLLVTALLTALVGINLFFYAPNRLNGLYNLYGISRHDQEAFLTPQAQELTPALVIVHSDRWMEYGALLDLQDPLLRTPFIFAWNMNDEVDAQVAASFLDRRVLHYYPEDPFTFYTAPLPEPPESQD